MVQFFPLTLECSLSLLAVISMYTCVCMGFMDACLCSPSSPPYMFMDGSRKTHLKDSKLQTGTPQNTGWLCPSSFYSLWQAKTGRGKLTKNTEILWGDWGLVPQSTHLHKQLVEHVIFVSKCRLVLAAEVWLKPGITWKHGEFYTGPVGM